MSVKEVIIRQVWMKRQLKRIAHDFHELPRYNVVLTLTLWMKQIFIFCLLLQLEWTGQLVGSAILGGPDEFTMCLRQFKSVKSIDHPLLVLFVVFVAF